MRLLVYAALSSVTAGAAAAQTADRTGAGATMQGKVRPIAAEQCLLLGAHTVSQKQVSETAHKLKATLNAAIMLGREQEQGTIEAGRIADLLILTGDPLVDPRNFGRIDRVVKGGLVYDPSELLRAAK